MREEIAKTKACIGPPALVAATLISGADRHVHVSQPLTDKCLGSACMGWVEMGDAEGDCCFKLAGLTAATGQPLHVVDAAPAPRAKKAVEQ